MNVLVHWLDEEFYSHSQHKCLAVKHVPRRHTASSLAEQFSEVIKEWLLDQNGLHVVVSGASVIKEALSKVVLNQVCSLHTHTLISSLSSWHTLLECSRVHSRTPVLGGCLFPHVGRT